MTVEGGQKKFEKRRERRSVIKRKFQLGVGVRLQLENETVFVSSDLFGRSAGGSEEGNLQQDLEAWELGKALTSIYVVR